MKHKHRHSIYSFHSIAIKVQSKCDLHKRSECNEKYQHKQRLFTFTHTHTHIWVLFAFTLVIPASKHVLCIFTCTLATHRIIYLLFYLIISCIRFMMLHPRLDDNSFAFRISFAFFFLCSLHHFLEHKHSIFPFLSRSLCIINNFIPTTIFFQFLLTPILFFKVYPLLLQAQ